MEMMILTILGVVAMAILIVVQFIKDKILTNRQFKPIELKEAEQIAKQLIQEKHGAGKNHMKSFYWEFILKFPEYKKYSYDYLLQCLNPSNDRSNPDVVEAVLILYNKPSIVAGSSRHQSMLSRRGLRIFF